MMKNAESADGFHIVSNLTLDQVNEGKGYNGLHNNSEMMITSSLETIPVSERK